MMQKSTTYLNYFIVFILLVAFIDSSVIQYIDNNADQATKLIDLEEEEKEQEDTQKEKLTHLFSYTSSNNYSKRMKITFHGSEYILKSYPIDIPTPPPEYIL